MKLDQISVCTFAYWHYTLDYCLDSIAAAGFKNVDFWAASPQYSYLDYTPEERIARKKEINAMLAARGLSMPVFDPEQQSMYPLNIASPNPYLEEHSMTYMKEYIDDAVDFGAKTMILAPGWHVEDDRDPANYDRSIRNMQALCAYAAERGIDLAIEEWPDIQRAWADSIACLKKMYDDVGAANLKVAVCTDMIHGLGETLGQFFDTFGAENIAMVRLADEGSRPLGTGRTAEKDIAELDARGYTGPVAIDIRFRDVCVAPDKPVFTSAEWLKKNGMM